MCPCMYITYLCRGCFPNDLKFFNIRAMLVQLAVETLGLHNKDADIPGMPSHIKAWSTEKKRQWLENWVHHIVQLLFVPVTAPDMNPVPLRLLYGDRVIDIHVPPHYRGKGYDVLIEGIIILYICMLYW